MSITFFSPEAIFDKLSDLLEKIKAEPRRDYRDSTQWNDGRTGGQPHACVYALWGDAERLVWIGQTTDLGFRLGEHFAPKNDWSVQPHFVQYLSVANLDDIRLRLLFERFLICLWQPLDNKE